MVTFLSNIPDLFAVQAQEIGPKDSRLLAIGVSHNGCVRPSHFVCLFCRPVATYVGDDRRKSAPQAQPPQTPHFSDLVCFVPTESKRSKCSLNNLKLIGPGCRAPECV